MDDSTTPEAVLDYWFGSPPQTEEELAQHVVRWFSGTPEVDAEITARFGSSVEAAVRGELAEWELTPRGTLALVLLLDQMTRNVFRNTPRMYAGDERARALTRRAFEDGTAKQLNYAERLFLSMPLLHSEELADQRRLAGLIDEIERDMPPLYAGMAPMHREQSAKYTDVIERFGRFPHRNELSGRKSSDAELEFLKDWAQKAPPAGYQAMKPASQ
jgi:uncharacterized protein (DUF924 family)